MILTYAITTAVAVMALISPVIVAVINNRHQLKLRKAELESDKLFDQANRIYSDKKVAYSNLISCASDFSVRLNGYVSYEKLISAINDANLYASDRVASQLDFFLDTVNESFHEHSSDYNSLPQESINEFSSELFDLTKECRRDLAASKPEISND